MKIKKLNETDKALKLKIIFNSEQKIDDYGHVVYGFNKFIGWIPKSFITFTDMNYGKKINIKDWWLNKKIIPNTTFIEVKKML